MNKVVLCFGVVDGRYDEDENGVEMGAIVLYKCRESLLLEF